MLLQLNVRYKTRVAPKLTGIKRLTADVAACRCASTTPPARRSCRSSRARSSRCTRAASRRTTPPTSATPPCTRSTTCCSGACIDLGHDVTLRAQHHRRRRPAARQGPRARRALPRPGRGRGRPASTTTWRRSTCCRVQRAAGHVGHPRHPRLHRHGARPRLRLPGRRRRCTSTCRRSPASARSATTPRSEMLDLRPRARRQRRRPEQAPPARLRAVAAVGAPTSRRWETMWGPGRPGLAHRVLGAGAARAGHHDRPARRRHRPDLPAPRVRAGAERGGHRRAVRAPLDARRHGVQGRREDVEEPRQPRVRRPAPRGVGPAGHPPGHHRAPLPRRRGSGTTS